MIVQKMWYSIMLDNIIDKANSGSPENKGFDHEENNLLIGRSFGNTDTTI